MPHPDPERRTNAPPGSERLLAGLTPEQAQAVTHGTGPLLLIAGEKDHIVPPVVTRATLKQYRRSPAVTELKQIAGRGHSLCIDSGWREVADTALGWLKQRSL